MKKFGNTFLYYFMLFFVLSCSVNKDESNTQANNNISVNKDVQPNYVANMLVSGMVCEVNCVSAVNNALMQLQGISSVEIDFDSERDTNLVSVKFDNTIVTEDKIKQTIESLNDNQYKVEKYEERILENNTQVKQDKEIHAATGVKINTEKNTYGLSDNFSMPNIFDVIFSFL